MNFQKKLENEHLTKMDVFEKLARSQIKIVFKTALRVCGQKSIPNFSWVLGGSSGKKVITVCTSNQLINVNKLS